MTCPFILRTARTDPRCAGCASCLQLQYINAELAAMVGLTKTMEHVYCLMDHVTALSNQDSFQAGA